MAADPPPCDGSGMLGSARVEFEGTQGHRLVGRLHRPASPRAWALFAHCFTCSKDIRAASIVSGALAAQGIATLRFDFTGLGESEGDFADTSFSSNIGDLVAAADYLREAHEAPSLLVGHSLGGAAVLAAAHRIEEVKAVATIGAPFDPEHVRHLIDASAPDLQERGEATVNIGGRPFRMKKQFLDDLAEQCSADKIATLKRALVVMHAPLDNIVGIENAGSIFGAARHPKSFISLDGADHLLRRPEDARFAGSVLAAWAERYLPKRDEATSTADPREVEVRGGSTGLAQAIRIGPHALVADEPISVGGGDTGPTPYDLLSAALGTCTSMTLQLYARRKKWPLEAVRVSLRHDKVHASDCEECETRTGKVDEIERVIEIVGALDDEQRARMLEIADKCPVHRTLHNEVVVKSRLAD